MSTVLIIHSHPVTAHGIEAVLQRAGHDVLSIAKNGLEGLELAREASPDLLITEIDVPRLGGLDVIKRLQASKAPSRSLVFTSLPSSVYEHLCLAAGAAGFVSASDSITTLLDAVTNVLAGRSYFRTRVLHIEAEAAVSPLAQLTSREIMVLHYLADGYRVKQIADEMALSDRTVSTYKSRLLEKVGANSLVELLQVAGQRGLIDRNDAVPASDEVVSKLDLQFNALLDAVPHPICMRAPDGRIQAANSAFMELLGIAKHAALNSLQRDLGVIDTEHLDYYRTTFESAVTNKAPYMMVVTIYVKGRRKVLRHSGCPVLDSSGNLIGMLCSSIDLEEEDMIIQSLRDEVSSLKTVRKRRGAYLLEQQTLISNEADLALKVIKHEGSDSLREVVSPLLQSIVEHVTLVGEMARFEEDGVVLNPYPQNLNTLTMEMLSRNSAGAALGYQFRAAPGEPMAWVDSDRYAALLKAVLLHLFKTNATNVKITAVFFDPHPATLQWRLNFRATLAPSINPQPVIYLALATELCLRFNGTFEVEASEANDFNALACMTFTTVSAQR